MNLLPLNFFLPCSSHPVGREESEPWFDGFVGIIRMLERVVVMFGAKLQVGIRSVDERFLRPLSGSMSVSGI